MPPILLRVLGGVRLETPQGETSVGGLLAERLVGVLVVAGGDPLDHDVIAEALWPDRDPGAAEPPLRMAVSRLRVRLSSAGITDGVESRRGTYALGVPPAQIDVERFVSLTETARQLSPTAPERAAAQLEGALALWRGEPFGPLATEEWAIAFVARLCERRLGAEEDLSELDLVRRREAIAVDRLYNAVEVAPLRERRWGQLATALYRLGRQAEALRAIDRARALLRDELGLHPGEGLLAIEQALLVQDPSLWASASSPAVGPIRPPILVGRHADVDEVRRLLECNRMVTIHGLGGVGKSALARAVAASGTGRAVVVAHLDGLADGDDVWVAVASASGIAGAEDPGALPAAVAGRLGAHGTLLVLDGAEAGAGTVAELADMLLVLAPTVKLLVTSRIPLGATGEVRYPLDGLPVGVGGDGDAVRLFLDRAGITASELDDVARHAVVRVCERTGGLPLAIELAAACVDRYGLDGLSAVDPPSVGSGSLRDALRWTTDVLPEESSRLLLRATLLPGGMSVAAAACLAEVHVEQVRRVLAPLVQARLIAAIASGAAGVRYREPEPVRELMAESLSPDEMRVAGDLIVGHLVAVATAVGDVDVQPRLSAVPAAEAELANVRHWLGRLTGTDEGLQLAVAIAPTMAQLGLGAEGRRWLDTHLGAAPPSDPLLLARATLAAANVAGYFARSALDVTALRRAAAIAEEGQAWRLWLNIRGHLAIERGWSGDGATARALLEDPAVVTRMAELGDPWMDAHRQRLLAVGLAADGRFAAARQGLNGLRDQFMAINDPTSALQTMFLRAWLARADQDMDGAAEDLLSARELAPTGAARSTQALIGAELAHLAHHSGDPAAPALLTAAVDDLERAGNVRSAAAQRRDLGGWLIAAGNLAGGLAELRGALPMLLRTDRSGAAVAVAELATVATHARDGAQLAEAAVHLLSEGSGPVDAVQRSRVEHVATMLGGDRTRAEGAHRLTDDEILTIALAPAAHV